MSTRCRRGASGTRSSTATRLARRPILSQNFVVDGSFGYTKHNVHVFPPVDTCYGDVFGIPNSCQPPYSLDTNMPIFNVPNAQGWVLGGSSPIRDYVDPQWQFVANAGWTKGSHNVKFGIDYIILHQDHYETQAPSFTFNGGVTTIPGGAAANNFNTFAAFLLGMPSSRTSEVMTPLIGGDALGARHPSSGHPTSSGRIRCETTTSARTSAISGT